MVITHAAVRRRVAHDADALAVVEQFGGQDVAVSGQFAVQVFFFQHCRQHVPGLDVAVEIHVVFEHPGERFEQFHHLAAGQGRFVERVFDADAHGFPARLIGHGGDASAEPAAGIAPGLQKRVAVDGIDQVAQQALFEKQRQHLAAADPGQVVGRTDVGDQPRRFTAVHASPLQHAGAEIAGMDIHLHLKGLGERQVTERGGARGGGLAREGKKAPGQENGQQEKREDQQGDAPDAEQRGSRSSHHAVIVPRCAPESNRSRCNPGRAALKYPSGKIHFQPGTFH